MKLHKEEALIWFSQAEHNLEVARHNLEAGFFSDACFMAEQAAQVSLKAFIIANKRRRIWEHSIQELASLSSQYDSDFTGLVEVGKILDRYYIPTRYPDALASPAVPYKTYTEKDAMEAVGLAEKVLVLVRHKIGGSD